MADSAREQLSSNDNRQASANEGVGHIVGTSLFVITLAQAGVSAALTYLLKTGVPPKPGPEEYAQFIWFYLSTFALSATLSIAVAVYAIPRMHGYDVPWGLSLLAVIAGAVLTSLTYPEVLVPDKESWAPMGGLRVWLIKLAFLWLATFAQIYGPLFVAGTITGLGGGLILTLVAHDRLQSSTANDSATRRKPLPWLGGVIGLSLTIVASALVIATLRG